MYKMVIADDEPAVRKYLRYIVKQYNLPFFICGEAEDGEQAVQMANIHQPEFFILDINMPVMNGLEAAKIIREKYRDAVIYILTAYSQFEYAHQAVQTQVAEYMLKPIKPAELVDMLKKGIAGVLRKRMAAQRLQRMERQIEQNRQAVIKQKLFQLLKNGDDNPNALKLLRQAACAHEKDFHPAAIISASYWADAAAPPPAGMAELLTRECSELFGKQAVVASFSEELVIIVNRWDYEFRRDLQTQLEKWEQNYNIKFCAGISLVNMPSQIGKSYNNARKKRETGLFWRQQGLLVVDDAVDGLKEIDCNDIQKKIQEYLLERETDKAKTVLRQFLEDLKRKVSCQPEQIYVAAMKIANHLIAKYAEYIVSADEAGLLRQNFTGALNKTGSANDLGKCLDDLIDKLKSHSCSFEQNQAEQSVKWAVEYIHNNYHKELTLEQFSEKLFMSTGYFCRSFKKYAGEGFASYLTNVRLEKARERLISGKYTVAEVARRVGFRDASYFSNVFKKHFGQSPSSIIADVKIETANNNR